MHHQQNQTPVLPPWIRIVCALGTLAVAVAMPMLVSSSWTVSMPPLLAGLLSAYVAATGRLPLRSVKADGRDGS